jgi:hypothetical protein
VKLQTLPGQLRARAHGRRLRVYVVGLGGSGTTTVAHAFDHYRSYHEVDSKRMVRLSTAAELGELSRARRRWEMRRRNARFGLEVDSAPFLTPFVPELADLYPRAHFVVLVRDCFTWMDTRIEKWLRMNAKRAHFRPPHRWAEYSKYAVAPSPEDWPLIEHDLPPVGNVANRWAAGLSAVLSIAPPDRTLVLRTEDIDTSMPTLAEFCGIDVSTLRSGVRANVVSDRRRLLSRLNQEHVVGEAERYCAPLMEEFWGADWRTLVHRVPGWDTVTP